MKNINEFINKTINEGRIRKQDIVDIRKDKIENWLKENEIDGYTINSDLTVNVYTDKRISIEGDLPDYIQFKNVDCHSFNWYEPTTLKGGPISVNCDYSFSVSSKKLETLKYCPKVLQCKFDCSGCPSLKTLKHLPDDIHIYMSRLDFEYLVKNAWGVKVKFDQYS